jgi:GNAT superfamily N-acetyltransferase
MDIICLTKDSEFFQTIARWHWDEWGHSDPAGSLNTWIENLSEKNRSNGIPATYAALNQQREPVGSVVLAKSDMNTHSELSPWLAGLFVVPAYRNKGVGTALVLHASQEALRFGFSTIFLHTATSTRLYEKLGWKTLFKEYYEEETVNVMSYPA